MARRRQKKAVPMSRTMSSSSIEEELPRPPPNVRKNLPVKSVVKIFTVASRPNFRQPWQMSQQEYYKGSGFVVQNNYILTNAHVVADYTTVRVRRHGGHHKFVAKVLCINYSCDLALLTVDDKAFWKDLPALEVADEVPQLDERVLVIGYPMGGDTISVTRGVVSRVTTLSYADCKFPQLLASFLLVVQIDAAINSGNSGGPVFRENGKVVGVAFSGYAGAADNIGYIIPYPVIKNFLEDYERRGTSDGVCDLGFSYELCENQAMQKMLKLAGDKSGVRIVSVRPLGASHNIIKPGDVVMKINGFKVANDGTIPFRQDERVHMSHAITSNSLGEDVEVVLLRDGRKKTVKIKGMRTPMLIPPFRRDKEMPSYLIVGGAVFTVMTGGLLDAAVDEFDDNAWEYSRRAKKYPDEQLVIRIGWLSHPINHGYASHRAERIAKCNGVQVRNIRHLKALCEQSKKFIVIETGVKRSIVFDVKETKKVEKEILETYAIPSPCSKDLVDVDASYEPLPASDYDVKDEKGEDEATAPSCDVEDADEAGVLPTAAATGATGGDDGSAEHDTGAASASSSSSSRGRRGGDGATMAMDARADGDHDNNNDNDNNDGDDDDAMPKKRAKATRSSPRRTAGATKTKASKADKSSAAGGDRGGRPRRSGRKKHA
ncbi:hypothetical protein PTSG_09760 [Salpingoeca rosetta]|uniref:PDZ domain-containing protein n=1 Tax=Salpingoeca rosetta (strain ATCC 50818 / BSB-021) TaxID=946362 RepID=F2UNZ1_SALR5|nr:uncharacterized protein PTSG_09760 [Salpingoeca rosetta]EGD79346.1 hypothetical protein PTSG_09760 [Salpingoeca rosetta]|eukprot:XP_004989115.1 hypothetical protein PTSG_09760 [Salpingoeca rosetta]